MLKIEHVFLYSYIHITKCQFSVVYLALDVKYFDKYEQDNRLYKGIRYKICMWHAIQCINSRLVITILLQLFIIHAIILSISESCHFNHHQLSLLHDISQMWTVSKHALLCKKKSCQAEPL